MRTATLQDLRQELKNLDRSALSELCTRLARYKKENKELLTYLLFEADNADGYIEKIKLIISEAFAQINTSNDYLVKKSVRKILRTTNRYIKYATNKIIEVELLMHFCTSFKNQNIPRRSTALMNLYKGQTKKLERIILLLQEDLQYDYMKTFDQLS